MVFGQGILVIFAGIIQDHTGLAKVDLHVAAKPGAALVQTAAPKTFSATPLEGDLRIVADPDLVEIAPETRPKDEAKALIALVKTNNLDHGFYGVQKKAAASSSWLDKFFESMGAPFKAFGATLEPLLRSHFGPEKLAKSDIVGNLGVAALHLSIPPGHDGVVTLGSRVGFGLGSDADKSFSIAEGSRFIFNDQNWNQPAMAVVQLDPKVKDAVSAAMEIRSGNIPLSWSITFVLLAALFVIFSIYHFFVLPYPIGDKPGDIHSLATFWGKFFRTFRDYFAKDHIGRLLLFLLFYRFAEAQLVRMVPLFLLDARDAGGLALTTSQLGFVYGTVGIAALTCGGLLGGMVAAKQGLKFWLWWMVLAIHLPDAVFVYLAHALPDNFWIINLCVAVEQFGYGFGFTAYMLYMIYIARGEHATAHYAICTGFMALGMLLPGLFSGWWLQEIIGYRHFFIWALMSTRPWIFGREVDSGLMRSLERRVNELLCLAERRYLFGNYFFGN